MYDTAMDFTWDTAKNEWLKRNRNISFERIVIGIEAGSIVDVLEHPDPCRYSGQILILVDIDDYIYVVPAEIMKNTFYLKTAFPGRKYTELYSKKRGNKT